MCPYNRAEALDYARVRSGQPGRDVDAHLGRFVSVVREMRTDASGSGSCLAHIGMQFANGDECNGRQRTANVTWTCLDTFCEGDDDADACVAALVARPQVVSAFDINGDACDWALDVPIAAACAGPSFGLCGAANPSPGASASPAPTFSYASAFVEAWSASRAVVWVAGASVPPQSIVLRTAAGLGSLADAPLPMPLAPSPSAVPSPFPSALQIIGFDPPAGGPGPHTSTLMLAGVSYEDFNTFYGLGANFRVRMVVSRRNLPGGGTSSSLTSLADINGLAQPPRNGLMNISIQLPARPAWEDENGRGWRVSVLSWFWCDGTCGMRSGVCMIPGGCDYPYLPYPSQTSSPSVGASATPSSSRTGSVSQTQTPSRTPSASLSPGAPPSQTPSPSPTPFLVSDDDDSAVVPSASAAASGLPVSATPSASRTTPPLMYLHICSDSSCQTCGASAPAERGCTTTTHPGGNSTSLYFSAAYIVQTFAVGECLGVPLLVFERITSDGRCVAAIDGSGSAFLSATAGGSPASGGAAAIGGGGSGMSGPALAALLSVGSLIAVSMCLLGAVSAYRARLKRGVFKHQLKVQQLQLQLQIQQQQQSTGQRAAVPPTHEPAVSAWGESKGKKAFAPVAGGASV